VDVSRHSTPQLERQTKVQVEPVWQVALELSPIDTVQSAPLEQV